MTGVRIATITLKSPEPQRLAAFWRELLGYVETDHPTSSTRLDDPIGRGPTLLIQPVGSSSARPPSDGPIHLDLRPDDHAGAVAQALDLGAVRADVGQTGGEGWEVLSDPDGNTFCLLAATPEGESAAIASIERPITPDDIAAALRATGVAGGDTIIVHSALSKLGWVVGGAHSVVVALLDAVGRDGTIVMPAQTGVSDPSTWGHPPVPESWWPIIREHWPVFDPNLTPMRAMGAVAECFARLPGVRHSGHPSVGFVAYGPEAERITARHEPADGLGDDSPLGRLYDLDARIVLLGVGHGNNTSLHLAEYRADFGDKSVTDHGAPLMVDGERRWVTYRDLDHDESDFVELGQAFVAAGGTERRAMLGGGEITSYHMRELVDFACDWMTANR